MTATVTGTALVHLPDPPPHGRWLRFTAPREVLVARHPAAVMPTLERLVAATTVDDSTWAVGFVAYEAAPGIDPDLVAHPPGEIPLLWWGLFSPPEEISTPTPRRRGDGPGREPDWRPTMDRRQHAVAVSSIRRAIARGDVYQVNLTFPLLAELREDPLDLFARLWRAQGRGYAAYLDTGRFAICSASPELFLTAVDGRLVSSPMKGTAARGIDGDDDERRAAMLRTSPKERAENVMIVDMVRNDLGRLAATGSVRVEEIFQVETYPTVHQLVSRVSASSSARLPDLLRGLFPAASITGAPKIAAMRLIRELEAQPRGVYTGAVGVLAPGGRLQLNVAIRTATVDRETATVSYGTGGGITWDSVAAEEYEECRTKAGILRTPRPPVELIETLRWQPNTGYLRLQRHLARLARSAQELGLTVDLDEVEVCLHAAIAGQDRLRMRVRLTLGADSSLAVTASPFAVGRSRWRVGLARRVDGNPPVDSRDRSLLHKSARRGVYTRALATRPDCDEVILWNERGELTEATRANLVLDLDDCWVTPSRESGLLPGVFREQLLTRRRVEERTLPSSALGAARRAYLVSSLRGIIRVDLVAT